MGIQEFSLEDIEQEIIQQTSDSNTSALFVDPPQQPIDNRPYSQRLDAEPLKRSFQGQPIQSTAVPTNNGKLLPVTIDVNDDNILEIIGQGGAKPNEPLVLLLRRLAIGTRNQYKVTPGFHKKYKEIYMPKEQKND